MGRGREFPDRIENFLIQSHFRGGLPVRSSGLSSAPRAKSIRVAATRNLDFPTASARRIRLGKSHFSATAQILSLTREADTHIIPPIVSAKGSIVDAKAWRSSASMEGLVASLAIMPALAQDSSGIVSGAVTAPSDSVVSGAPLTPSQTAAGPSHRVSFDDANLHTASATASGFSLEHAARIVRWTRDYRLPGWEIHQGVFYATSS